MSQRPELPGTERFKRAAESSKSTGGRAYEGAFEAVGAVVISIGIGYWVDSTWETSPAGVLVGAVVGFAAMVLRLVRLGKQLHPEGDEPVAGTQGPEIDDEDLGVGEAPGVSSVLVDDD